MLRTGLFLLESMFSGVFLWLGLYLITRDTPIYGQHNQRWWQRSALDTGIAFICMAVYLVGIAMMIIVDDPRKVVLWLRLTWWSTPLAAAFFFWGILLVTTQEERSPRRRMLGRIVSLLLLAYTIGIASVGTTTNLVFQFDAVRPIPRPPYYLEVPPQYPFYALYVAVTVGTLLVGTFLIFQRYSATQGSARRQFQWLGLGAASATLGAIIGFAGLVSRSVDQYLPTELGDALLTVGVFTIGHGVARYNAFFQNQTITRDFYRSLTGVVVTSVVFVLIFSGLHWLTGSPLAPESIPLLIWLATLTLTSRAWVSERLDQIFLPRAAVLVRRMLNRAGDQIAIAEDQQQALLDIEEQMPQMITVARLQELQTCISEDINKVFSKTNYKHNTYLSEHTDLLDLAIVEEAATALMVQDGVSPALDRAPYLRRAFWRIIHGLVEDMNPEASATAVLPDDAPNLSFKEQQAHYMILNLQFIKQEPREVVQGILQSKLEMGFGGGYGRLQKAAKERLAQRLYLAERKVREAQGGRREVPQALGPIASSIPAV